MPFIRDDDHPLKVCGLVIGAVLVLMTLIGQCGPVLFAAAESHILSMGIVNFSDHELDAGGVGYFAIGHSEKQGTVIMAPVDSSAWLVLRDLRDQKVIIRVERQP
jgi:hypothetical protein